VAVSCADFFSAGTFFAGTFLVVFALTGLALVFSATLTVLPFSIAFVSFSNFLLSALNSFCNAFRSCLTVISIFLSG